MKTTSTAYFVKWTCPTCLYPTFKEWKRIQIKRFTKSNKGLYPTFKEWKLANCTSNSLSIFTCLYPTFKEWKRI